MTGSGGTGGSSGGSNSNGDVGGTGQGETEYRDCLALARHHNLSAGEGGRGQLKCNWIMAAVGAAAEYLSTEKDLKGLPATVTLLINLAVNSYILYQSAHFSHAVSYCAGSAPGEYAPFGGVGYGAGGGAGGFSYSGG